VLAGLWGDGRGDGGGDEVVELVAGGALGRWGLRGCKVGKLTSEENASHFWMKLLMNFCRDGYKMRCTEIYKHGP
jgi:hypothetical protein